MRLVDLTIPKGAIFSDDRTYRYVLWRIWNRNRAILLSIGLNPSTASELNDDPTITRETRRAYDLGFGGLFKWNLYAYVSSDPDVLLGDGDFVGAENDLYLKQLIGLSSKTVCGWGSFPAVKNRASIILKMIPEPYCLGVNKDREPKHPLYIGYNQPMIKYSI
jgi:hypothetical protein